MNDDIELDDSREDGTNDNQMWFRWPFVHKDYRSPGVIDNLESESRREMNLLKATCEDAGLPI